MKTGPAGGTSDPGAPYAHRAGQGSSVEYMGCPFSVLAASDETDGRFGLIEMVAPRGLEPSRHLQYHDDEGYYVLAGNATCYVGEETYEAGRGTFVFGPRGLPHSYSFHTDVVRMLAIVAPEGIEQHSRAPRFAEPSEAPNLPPSAGEPYAAFFEEMAEDLASYGTALVGPPGLFERR